VQTIQLRIPDYLFRSIEQACDIRGCLGTEQYMLQLAEADTAEFRVKKIVKTPIAPKGEPAPKNGNATRSSKAGKGATWADARNAYGRKMCRNYFSFTAKTAAEVRGRDGNRIFSGKPNTRTPLSTLALATCRSPVLCELPS
jgi:hypothetical protein